MLSHVFQSPYVNLLKLLDKSHVQLHGDAKESIDRTIGKKVYAVRGRVAPDNYIQIPTDRSQSLGLKGRFVYVQLKPTAGKHFVLNLTFMTIGHGSLHVSLSNAYKSRKLLGSVLQLPYPEPSDRWATIAIDGPRLIKEVYPSIAGDGSLEYVCFKALHGTASFSLRAVFTSDVAFTPSILPRDVIFPLPRNASWEHLYAWQWLPAAPAPALDAAADSPDTAASLGATQLLSPASTAGRASNRHGSRAPRARSGSPSPRPKSRGGTAGAESENVAPKPHAFSGGRVPTWATPAERPAPTPRPKLDPTRVLSGHAPPASPPRSGAKGPAAGARGEGVEASSPESRRTPLSSQPTVRAQQRACASACRSADGGESVAGGVGGGGGSSVAAGSSAFSPAAGSSLLGAGVPSAPSLTSAPDALVRLRRTLALNCSAPHAAAWLHDGETVAYGAAALVVLHHVESGAHRHLVGHTARVCSLSACGGTVHLLASAQEGRMPTVRLWLPSSGACVGVLCAHVSDLCCLALSADGALLAACGSDAGARQVLALWETAAVRTGGAASLLTSKRTEHHVAQLRFCAGPADDELGSDEERYRFLTCGAENVVFWRLRGGTLRSCVADLRGHSHEAFVDIAVDPVGRTALNLASTRRAFVSTASGKLLQLRVESRELEFVFQLHATMISAVHLTEGFCVTGSVDGVLRVWPLDFSEFLLEAEHDGPISALDATPDGLTMLIAVDRVNSLGLMDLSTHRHVTLVRTHVQPVRCVAADPRRRQFATLSLADQSVRVWELDGARQLSEFEATAEPPTAVCYHASEHTLAVGYESGAVRVFDVETTSMQHEYKLHNAPVLALAFDAAGRSLYSASADGALVAYDATKDYWPLQVYAAPRPGERVCMQLVRVRAPPKPAPPPSTAAGSTPASSSAATGTSASGGGGGGGGGTPAHGGGGAAEPTEALVVCGLERTCVLLFDPKDLRRPPAQLALGGAAPKARCLALTPDGVHALVGTADGGVLRAELASGEIVSHAKGLHRESIDAIAVSADGSRVYTGGADRILKVWHARALFPSRHNATAVAIAAAASGPGASSSARAAGGLPPHQAFVAHGDAITSIAIAAAPGGAPQLVTTDAGGLVAIWDALDPQGDGDAEGSSSLGAAAGRVGSARRRLASAELRLASAEGSRAGGVGSAEGWVARVPSSHAARATPSSAPSSAPSLAGDGRPPPVADARAREAEAAAEGGWGVDGGAARSVSGSPAAGRGAAASERAVPLGQPPARARPSLLPPGTGSIGFTVEGGAGSLDWRAAAARVAYSSGGVCVVDDHEGGARQLAVLPTAQSLCVAFDEAAERVALADAVGRAPVAIWSVSDRSVVSLHGLSARVLAMHFDATGERLVVLTDGVGAPVLSAWDAARGTLVATRDRAEGDDGADSAEEEDEEEAARSARVRARARALSGGDALGERDEEEEEEEEDEADPLFGLTEEEVAALRTRPLAMLESMCALPSSAHGGCALAVAGATGVQVWELSARSVRRARLLCMSTWDVEASEQSQAAQEGVPPLASLGRSLLLCGDKGGRLCLYHTRAGWTTKTEPLADEGQRVTALGVHDAHVDEEGAAWTLLVGCGPPGPLEPGQLGEQPGCVQLFRLSLPHPTQRAPAAPLHLEPLHRVELPAPVCAVRADPLAALVGTTDGGIWHVQWAEAAGEANVVSSLASTPPPVQERLVMSADCRLLLGCSGASGCAVWWVGGDGGDGGDGGAGGATAAAGAASAGADAVQVALLRMEDQTACTCVAMPHEPSIAGQPGSTWACAVGFESGKVHLFDLSSVEMSRELHPHARGGVAPAAGSVPVECVCFAPNDVLLSANALGEVVMTDLKRADSPARLLRNAGGARAVELGVGSTGAWLLLTEATILCVWDQLPAEPGAAGPMAAPVLELALVTASLAPTSGGAAGGGGGAVATFAHKPTPAGRAAALQSATPRGAPVDAVVCSGIDFKDGGAAPYVMAYDAAGRRVCWSCWLEAPVDALAAAPNADICAIVLANGSVELLGKADGRVVRRLHAPGPRALSLCLADDGACYVANGSTIVVHPPLLAQQPRQLLAA